MPESDLRNRCHQSHGRVENSASSDTVPIADTVDDRIASAADIAGLLKMVGTSHRLAHGMEDRALADGAWERVQGALHGRA